MKKILKNVIARKYLCNSGLLRHFIPRNDGIVRFLGVLSVVMVLGLSVFASDRVQVTLSRVYDGD